MSFLTFQDLPVQNGFVVTLLKGFTRLVIFRLQKDEAYSTIEIYGSVSSDSLRFGRITF